MFEVVIGTSKEKLKLEISDNGITIDGNPVDSDVSQQGKDHYHILIDNKGNRIEIHDVNEKTGVVLLSVNGKQQEVKVRNRLDLLLEEMGMGADAVKRIADVKAPMPGLVLGIEVEVGTAIETGTPLLILEAMKMENVIKADGSGVVKAIKIEKGQAVEKGEVLIVME